MTPQQWKTSLEERAAKFKERRFNDRCAFVACADLVDISSNSPLAARTADIDRGGCYIDTLNPLEMGAKVTVQLRSEGQSFKARAEVVYVQAGNGMGLAFTAPEAEQSRTLEKWIAGLSAENTTPLPEPVRVESPEPTIASMPAAVPDRERPMPLTHLILMLAQKKILSETEAKALLKKIHR